VHHREVHTGDAADRADQRVARQLVDHHGTRAWLLSLAGTEHFNFSDYGAYQLAAPLRLLLAVGSADGRQALDDTDGYVSAFVDHVTGRGTSPLLDGTRSIPGVRLLAHP
jgi:hypothetical protein